MSNTKTRLPIDRMTADAHRVLKAIEQTPGYPADGDLACHVLALAAELERADGFLDRVVETTDRMYPVEVAAEVWVIADEIREWRERGAS